ncbi:MAG: HD-GYP domain-containing protein [Gammaproteobacteria bacterium]|nr:HD-GYP domain-containing protein [Gammaproteobacteria bacterium]MDH5310211.1 HD-GYP domain-containing protein [Gammaproteobacteria bacterium]
MSLAKIPVDVTKLSVGMYVSKLDRPWLETPFVFQGFEIRDRFEIEQLQAHCSYVVVDVDRGQLTEAQIRALLQGQSKRSFPQANGSARDAGQIGFLTRVGIRFGLGGFLALRARKNGDYPITSTVRREAPRAREAWQRAVERQRILFNRARHSGTVRPELAGKLVQPLIDSILRNPDAMAWSVFSGKRSARKYSRPVATAIWAIMFGRHLGFDRGALKELAIGGLLLDIGNIRLPDEVVNAEGAITLEQYDEVPKHVEAGVDIVMASGAYTQRIVDMVSCHHERYDGSGYPYRLSGSKIPIFGRIAAIVDTYDAMTTRKPYLPALAAYDAARELNDMRDKQFQGEVVEQFLQMIGMFPTGSVVELSDGTVGLVLEQNRANPLRPKVMLLMSKNGEPFDQPRIVDMSAVRGNGAPEVFIEKGHEHGAFGIDPATYFN